MSNHRSKSLSGFGVGAAQQLLGALALGALAIAGAMSAPAANRYVRAGATGANNGTDWNNAYTQLPATLVRGDTYYIADGTYPGYTFTTPASGTNFIYIKKATIADHGTDVGWQDSYGDGQAVFGPMVHNAPNGGYIDMNGYSPHVPGGHGFKIDFDKLQVGFDFVRGGKEFKFRYIDFDGVASSGDVDFGGPPWTYTIKVLPWNGSSYDDTSGMLISNCKLHGSATHIQDNSGNANIVIEYSEFYDCRSVGVDHGNIYWIGSSGGTFRYNKVYNYNVEGLLLGLNNSNWKIYGNIFFDGVSVARGIELYGGRTHTGTKIYNNTFVNIPLAAVRVESDAVCSGVEIRNNLIYNSGGMALENGGAGITTSANLTAAASDFLNPAAKDYRLARPTAPGTVLPAPVDMDFDGRPRGADGVWDVGAFEFVSAPPTNPVISVSPTALNFGQVTIGQTNDLTITVRNIGIGTLQGTATVP
ncbi:MAG: right-handed parallel beta-helix repeat-containing protein, partial [Verrucomicrobiales bacterium]|nr:right-handed parallel beta-helix repeat-containing protein [Verrucomicrobiales bacterium]